MAHVLVVDDNQPVRDTLQRAVGQLGHSVAATSDMAEALELVAAQQPDLVVVDADMIFVEELLQAMAELVRDRWPPLLFTAHAKLPQLPGERLACASRSVLQKPFTLRAFDAAIVAALAAGRGG